MSNDTPNLKGPQKAEVEKHAKDVLAHSTKNSSLEQQIVVIESKVILGYMTKADGDAKIATIRSLMEANKAKEPKATDSNLTTPDGHEVAAEMVKAEYLKMSLEQQPALSVNGLGEIRYVSLEPEHISEYIDVTVHLNPWGRMRQCDEDLKNLMATIGRDINHELGSWIEIGKRVGEAATE